jgi:methanogenic corrinoid protein MtbC1
MSTPDRADLAESESSMRRLLDTVQGELIPRMYLSHRAGPVPPALGLAVGRRLSDDDRAEFLRRVRGASETSAAEQVRTLVAAGVSLEAVFLDLLAPAARTLGHEWETDACDFVEVTVSLGRMQRLLRSFSTLSSCDLPSGESVGRVLLSSISTEQHTLGLYMVAEFFVRAGWSVTLGAPIQSLELEQAVAQEWFDVAGLSVSCTSRVPQVKQTIADMRRRSKNPHMPILVGGCLFTADPSLVQEVGADGSAPDASAAPALAARLAGLRQAE